MLSAQFITTLVVARPRQLFANYMSYTVAVIEDGSICLGSRLAYALPLILGYKGLVTMVAGFILSTHILQ